MQIFQGSPLYPFLFISSLVFRAHEGAPQVYISVVGRHPTDNVVFKIGFSPQSWHHMSSWPAAWDRGMEVQGRGDGEVTQPISRNPFSPVLNAGEIQHFYKGK